MLDRQRVTATHAAVVDPGGALERFQDNAVAAVHAIDGGAAGPGDREGVGSGPPGQLGLLDAIQGKPSVCRQAQQLVFREGKALVAAGAKAIGAVAADERATVDQRIAAVEVHAQRVVALAGVDLDLVVDEVEAPDIDLVRAEARQRGPVKRLHNDLVPQPA